MNSPEQQLLPLPDQAVTRSERNGRLFFLKLALLVFFVVIAGRLVKIQIIDAAKFQAIARKQYEQKFLLPAVRGNLYDRNGNVLVSNTMYVSFAADPKMIGEKADAVAEKFSLAFRRPKTYYLTRLHSVEASRRFLWLERRVSPDVARRLESADLEGVVVINEPKRLYHYDDLAGPLIGFTDIDNKGISGLELQFDEEFRGTSGLITMQRDGLGRARPSADYPYIAPVNGQSVLLTIDLAYQAIVEEELKKGVTSNDADGGLAVIMNPKTGEILALAIVPGINPNDVSKLDLPAAKNRVITDTFEPGSVFKIVTAGAAYEHGLVAPDKRFNAENGEYRQWLPGGRVRLIKDTHKHAWLTFQEGMEQSSNIVMAKASDFIGPELFYRQARDFGFGIPTGIDLPGEVRGRLKNPQEWSGTTLQAMSYGYEVAVTPLQIVAAYSAVANGGTLMKPYIVAQVRDEQGEVLREQRPQRIRQVVSRSTALLLTQAFEGVVERGTAREVIVRGIRIAGKTGTAKRVVDGKYLAGSYTTSFVGYYPVEDPQVVCLVMMDNPKAQSYFGGSTSGPIFRAIAERVIHTSSRFSLPSPPAGKQVDQEPLPVPDVRNVRLAIARRLLEDQGLRNRVYGSGDIVVRQSPEPGARIERGDIVRLAVNQESVPDQKGLVTVPELRGMSVRRALNRLVIDEFDVVFRGSGVVMSQDPLPGRRVRVGTQIRLVCESRNMATATLY